jgi:hypothetical protein
MTLYQTLQYASKYFVTSQAKEVHAYAQALKDGYNSG